MDPVTTEALALLLSQDNAMGSANDLYVRLHEAIPFAERVRKLSEKRQWQLDQVASEVIGVRRTVLLGDSLPDWAGTSKAVKLITLHLIEVTCAVPRQHVANARNVLMREVARLLPMAVLDYVLHEHSIEMSKTKKLWLLELGPRWKNADLTDTELFVIGEVNRHYRMNQHDPRYLTSPYGESRPFAEAKKLPTS